MSKTFTKPFARSDFPLHSTSKESGRAALVTAVALNNLDVPDFLVLIYPRGAGGGCTGGIVSAGEADTAHPHQTERWIR